VTTAGSPRSLHVLFQPRWDPAPDDPGRQGLLAPEPRVRTLLKVLVTYPEVRYVLPDRLSLEPGADPKLLETIGRFLERQGWLVKGVVLR
jgi:hypothetical protein